MPTATISASKTGKRKELEFDAYVLRARMSELAKHVNVANEAERQRLARDLAVIERILGMTLAKPLAKIDQNS
jgi:hypothetical protein